jgi:hypothetical protein
LSTVEVFKFLKNYSAILGETRFGVLFLTGGAKLAGN